MKLRKHQQEFSDTCTEIRNGSKVRRILALVTPGGGKSNLPVIIAKSLIPTHIDKIAWITPRIALCTQAEESFVEYGFGLKIRRSDHEYDPSRGLAGFSSTYNSTFGDCSEFVKDFERYRYALIFDECHHLEEGGTTHKAILPLMQRAAMQVYLSGNINRHDEVRVAGLKYSLDDKSRWVLSETNSTDTALIQYNRKQAILERAVLPAYFDFQDGKAKWLGKDGKERDEASIAALTGGDARSALSVVLQTGYAIGMIERSLCDWLIYKKDHPRSKYIVLAPNVKTAKIYVQHIQRKGYKADYAVSTDDEDPSAARRAQSTIKRFKDTEGSDRLDILVAVGMAHEGLDVKSASHLVILTHIRSAPWLEQAIARVTRFDPFGGPYEFQQPRVYIPDDEMAHAAVATIQAEQIEAIRQRDEADAREGVAKDPTYAIPISSEATRSRSATFDAALDYDETERIQVVSRRLGINAPPILLKALLDDLNLRPQSAPAETAAPVSSLTPREEEDHLRKAIQKMCSRIDYKLNLKSGTTSKITVYDRFGSRTKMTIPKLHEVLAWLQQEFEAATV